MAKPWSLFYLIFLVISFVGCGGAKVIIHKSPKEDAYPLAIAILPFTVGPNVEDKSRPAEILRRVFFTHFRYLGYSDLSLDTVDKRLKSSGYSDPANLSNIGIEELRKLLGADAIIKGHIMNANNFTGGIYAETWIQAKLEMIDLRSGLPIWETEHQERDQSSIISPTVISMIQQQVENSDPMHAYQKVSEEFALQVVSHIPDPSDQRKKNIKLPEIQSLNVTLSSHHILYPGDSVTVVLNGDRGMKASFDIGNLRTRIPMNETLPGIYEGEYLITSTDQIKRALVIGRLVDHLGLTRKKIFRDVLVTSGSPKNIVQGLE